MTRAAVAGGGALLAILILLLAPAAALGGWRAAFLAAGSVPAGAVMLLLIARLTGADWGAALLPLAGLAWMLLPAFVPVAVEQALFVTPPQHLAWWLAPPAFVLRGLLAIGLWWWLARALARNALSPLGAGLGLVAHGVVVTIVGTDWLLGTSPGQPNSAIGMAWVAAQVVAATGAACLIRLGTPALRRDLSFLLVAAALGLAYLLFMDFLIVWYGNLPARVGWYVARQAMPAALLPSAALLLGLALPIACVALVRTEGARGLAGAGALAGLVGVMLWMVGPSGLALPAAAGGAALAAALAPGRPA